MDLNTATIHQINQRLQGLAVAKTAGALSVHPTQRVKLEMMKKLSRLAHIGALDVPGYELWERLSKETKQHAKAN